MKIGIAIFLLALPTVAYARPWDERQQEVIKMFSALLSKMDVRKGDGSGSDLYCIFTTKWDESVAGDAAGESTGSARPRELLSIQQALDPLNRHPDMFCNYDERNVQAQKLARASKRTIAVASVGFSYPDFDPSLQTASVYYRRQSNLYLPQQGKKVLPVGSNGVIRFIKQNGAWSFTIKNLGTMD